MGGGEERVGGGAGPGGGGGVGEGGLETGFEGRAGIYEVALRGRAGQGGRGGQLPHRGAIFGVGSRGEEREKQSASEAHRRG